MNYSVSPLRNMPPSPAQLESGGTKAASGSRDEMAAAAQQFEALMLNQLLRSACSEKESWLGTGDQDQAGLQAMELAQEQFAAALAARGGLGLARLVVSQLVEEPKSDGPAPGNADGSAHRAGPIGMNQ